DCGGSCDVEEQEPGAGGRSGRGGERLRRGGDGRQRPCRRLHGRRPQPHERQDEARGAPRQQDDTVEAEQRCPTHHQQEERVEDGQIQAASSDI
ncbi:MAG: hypothetical protein IKZ72_00300, partial [Bacteroidales bacterium]|nr:hypothetical protein [Bacteroidales bacterium]